MSANNAPPIRGDDYLVGAELGEYRIERVIGRGGMGVVYLAVDDVDRTLALKLMLPELANNPDFRERFIRESQAVIEHPNIVKVFEAGEIGSTLYLAMQYVDGIDLKDLIVKEGRLLPARAVALFTQAAEALDAAHESGMVHRDVKPQNILIAPEPGRKGREHVYLTDFGLVKRTSSQSSFTHSAYLMGTVQYMAPEQIAGHNVDGRADVYGLACVVYESITGQIPFDKDSDISVMWAHVNDPAPPPSSIAPVLPESVDAVFDKALAKSPADRYLTCGEFVGELKSALGVSSGKSAKPVWSSGKVAASFEHKRPSGPQPAAPRRAASEPVAGPIGGWVAAVIAAVVAIAAVVMSASSESPGAKLLGDPSVSGRLDSAAASPPADEPRERDRRDRPRPSAARGGESQATRSKPRADGTRSGGAAAARSGSRPANDSSQPPAPIAAPASGSYGYRQQGYEQQCLNTCSGGQNLPDSATASVVRVPSSSDRATVITRTTFSNRWRTEITTDYFRRGAALMAIDMRYSGTPAWRDRIEPATPIEWLRFPLEAGKAWSGRWDEDLEASDGATLGSYRIEVLGRTRQAIAGRTIDTVKLHATVEFTGSREGTWDLYVWIDPVTRAAVKTSGSMKVQGYEMSLRSTLTSGPGY